jgi:hypothetical protein
MRALSGVQIGGVERDADVLVKEEEVPRDGGEARADCFEWEGGEGKVA